MCLGSSFFQGVAAMMMSYPEDHMVEEVFFFCGGIVRRVLIFGLVQLCKPSVNPLLSRLQPSLSASLL